MRKIEVENGPTPTEIDRDSVARVVALVELSDIRLVWTRAGLNIAQDQVTSDWAERTFIGYDVHATAWADDESFFTVEAYFAAAHNVEWGEADAERVPEFSEDSPPDVDIAVLFELIYSIEDATGITDHDIEHFASYNAMFNAWPYWRELAQTVTNRMRIPTLMIPVLRVPSVRVPAANPPAETET